MENLTSLRERAPYYKLSRGQIHAHPGVGQVALIKEDNMPRDVWKIGRIDSLCNSSDGKVRAPEDCLLNGRHIKRAINHLCQLEVADENLKFKEVTSKMNYDSDNSFIQCARHIKETNHKKLPMRQAAITARQQVNQLLKENALTVLFTITIFYYAIFIFCLPSVMEHELIYYIMYINVHYLKCVCILLSFIIMNQSPESSKT